MFDPGKKSDFKILRSFIGNINVLFLKLCSGSPASEQTLRKKTAAASGFVQHFASSFRQIYSDVFCQFTRYGSYSNFSFNYVIYVWNWFLKPGLLMHRELASIARACQTWNVARPSDAHSASLEGTSGPYWVSVT